MNIDNRLDKIEEQIRGPARERQGGRTLEIPADIAPQVRTESTELESGQREHYSEDVAAAIRKALARDRPD